MGVVKYIVLGSGVLPCVAVCCRVRCRVLPCVAVCRSELQCVAVYSSVLQRVAACCSVLQCGAHVTTPYQ